MKALFRLVLLSTIGLAHIPASAQNAPQDASDAAAPPPAGLIIDPSEFTPPVKADSLALFGSAPVEVSIRQHSLRQSLPVPGQQVTATSRNGCVAWTLSYGLLSYALNLKDNPRNPHYTYHFGALYSRPKDYIGPLEDSGCSFAAGYLALVDNGSCDLADHHDFRRGPRSTVSAKARKHRLQGVQPLKSLNVTDVFDLKSRLLRGRPLPAGFHIYAGFGLDPKTTAGQPSSMFQLRTLREGERAGTSVPVWFQAGNPLPSDELPRHAMLITGYDTSIRAFEVLNSYGPDWGDGGYIWIDEDFFKNFSGETSPCCLVAYDYQDTVESFFHANGGRQVALESVNAGTAAVYIRFGVIQDGESEFPPPETGFDVSSLEDLKSLQPGDVLTVRGPGVLNIRPGFAYGSESGNNLLLKTEDIIGTLRAGDRFKISDIRRVRVEAKKTYEYWLYGTVEATPPATPPDASR